MNQEIKDRVQKISKRLKRDYQVLNAYCNKAFKAIGGIYCIIWVKPNLQ